MLKNVSINCISKIQTIKSGFLGNLKDLHKKAHAHVLSDNKAQGIIEYGLLLAVVAVALIAIITQLKNKIQSKIQEAINGIK